MRKGHSIIGLQVLTQESGADLGKVLDLLFDHDADQCLGLVLREASMLGLIAPRVVPWEAIVSIGKDAVMVPNEAVVLNPLEHAAFKRIWERDTALSGTRIITEDGRDLGAFSEVLLDETSGRVVGYEVSGGMVEDTMSGKRFVPAHDTDDLRVGADVIVASPALADEFDRQKAEEPGGLTATSRQFGEQGSEFVENSRQSAGALVDDARARTGSALQNVAGASLERQREWAVGRVAGQDVWFEPPGGGGRVREQIVAAGATISDRAFERAHEHGALPALMASAGAGEVGQGLDSLRSGALERAVGQRAAFEVADANGSLLLAAGQLITPEIARAASQRGLEDRVVAAALSGAVQQRAAQATDRATDAGQNAWDSITDTARKLLGVAQVKKDEMDAQALQARINRSLGRPVTRVILSRDDSVILNTGDIITNRAIERAGAEGMLEALLDSVHAEDPEITPEMARLEEPGEAALPEQAEPSGEPGSGVRIITATVDPTAGPAQPAPPQGDLSR